MKRLSIRLDEQYVRQAIRQAIRHAECRAMRDAYRKQPDSAQEADDWSTAGEFRQ
jgi:hypothetical protein